MRVHMGDRCCVTDGVRCEVWCVNLNHSWVVGCVVWCVHAWEGPLNPKPQILNRARMLLMCEMIDGSEFWPSLGLKSEPCILNWQG